MIFESSKLFSYDKMFENSQKTDFSLKKNQSLLRNVLRISMWEQFINGKINNFGLNAWIFLDFWGPVVNFGASYDDKC